MRPALLALLLLCCPPLLADVAQQWDVSRTGKVLGWGECQWEMLSDRVECGTSIPGVRVHMPLSSPTFVGLTLTASPSQVHVGPYIHERRISAGAPPRGPTAPAWAENGNVAGMSFDIDAESVHLSDEIHCWNQTSNAAVEVYWTNQSGFPLGDGQTVKWDYYWASITFGEDVGNGPWVTGTITHTQSGAGVDGETYKSKIVLDYDNAISPMVLGDKLNGHFDRDVATDTYGYDAIVSEWHIEYQTNVLCE